MNIYQCPNCDSDETHFVMDSTYKCESCSHYFDRSEATLLAQDWDDLPYASINGQLQAVDNFSNPSPSFSTLTIISSSDDDDIPF